MHVLKWPVPISATISAAAALDLIMRSMKLQAVPQAIWLVDRYHNHQSVSRSKQLRSQYHVASCTLQAPDYLEHCESDLYHTGVHHHRRPCIALLFGLKLLPFDCDRLQQARKHLLLTPSQTQTLRTHCCLLRHKLRLYKTMLRYSYMCDSK